MIKVGDRIKFQHTEDILQFGAGGKVLAIRTFTSRRLLDHGRDVTLARVEVDKGFAQDFAANEIEKFVVRQ